MAQRDHRQQVQQEDAIARIRHEWMQNRVTEIHRHLSAFDVLRRHGVELRSSSDREEQFSCPFHGSDNKPSARIYPESTRGPSHAWCFVCQERWDAISLWRKFNGGAELPFARALSQIEQACGIQTPEMPAELRGGGDTGPSLDLATFDTFYELCERRLMLAKAAYQKLDDMIGFLSACSLLDKLRYRVDKQQLSPEQGTTALEQLLAKIGKKVQACPDV